MASKADKTSEQPVEYIHVDEFAGLKQLSEEIKQGFKIFLQGRLYFPSLEALEKELEAFLTRKI